MLSFFYKCITKKCFFHGKRLPSPLKQTWDCVSSSNTHPSFRERFSLGILAPPTNLTRSWSLQFADRPTPEKLNSVTPIPQQFSRPSRSQNLASIYYSVNTSTRNAWRNNSEHAREMKHPNTAEQARWPAWFRLIQRCSKDVTLP